MEVYLILVKPLGARSESYKSLYTVIVIIFENDGENSHP